MKNMEYLYTMNSKFTFEEYKKFNYALLKKRHHFLILVIYEILLLLLGIGTANIFMIAFAIIFPSILYWIQSRNIKRIYNSNKVAQDLDVTYEFYDTYFIEKSEHGEMKIEYSKFDEIFETKTNFYLMIAKNQGYMLRKLDMPNGLEEFIRNIEL